MHDLTIRKTTLPWDSGEAPFFKHYIATCAGFKEGFRMCNSHSGVLLRVELVLSSSTGDGPAGQDPEVFLWLQGEARQHWPMI
jgi:hypothetical protein